MIVRRCSTYLRSASSARAATINQTFQPGTGSAPSSVHLGPAAAVKPIPPLYNIAQIAPMRMCPCCSQYREVAGSCMTWRAGVQCTHLPCNGCLLNWGSNTYCNCCGIPACPEAGGGHSPRASMPVSGGEPPVTAELPPKAAPLAEYSSQTPVTNLPLFRAPLPVGTQNMILRPGSGGKTPPCTPPPSKKPPTTIFTETGNWFDADHKFGQGAEAAAPIVNAPTMTMTRVSTLTSSQASDNTAAPGQPGAEAPANQQPLPLPPLGQPPGGDPPQGSDGKKSAPPLPGKGPPDGPGKAGSSRSPRPS